MRKLLMWCWARGVSVDLQADGSYYYPDRKHIEVNGRLGSHTRLYHLLHECGHHLIAKSGARLSSENGDTRSMGARLAVVDEEIEAWHRGRRLAARLGIRIDRKRWAKVRNAALATYIKWAA